MLFYAELYDTCARHKCDTIIFSHHGVAVPDLADRPRKSSTKTQRLVLKTVEKWKFLEQVLVSRARNVASANAKDGQDLARKELRKLLHEPAGSDVAELLGIAVGAVPWGHRGRSIVFGMEERKLLRLWFMVDAGKGDEWHDVDGPGCGMKMTGETTDWPEHLPTTGALLDGDEQYVNMCGRLVRGNSSYNPFGPFMMHVLVHVFSRWPNRTFEALVLDATLLATAQCARLNARARLAETHTTLRVLGERMSARYDFNPVAWYTRYGEHWTEKDMDESDPAWPKVCPELLAVADLTVCSFAMADAQNSKWGVLGNVHKEWKIRLNFWDEHWSAFEERFVEYWVWQSTRAGDGGGARGKPAQRGGQTPAPDAVVDRAASTDADRGGEGDTSSGAGKRRRQPVESDEKKRERLQLTAWKEMDAEDQEFWRGESGGNLPTRRQGEPESGSCSYGPFCDRSPEYKHALSAGLLARWPYECKLCMGTDSASPPVLDKGCLERYVRVMVGGWAAKAVEQVWAAIESADGRTCKCCTDTIMAQVKATTPAGVYTMYTTLHRVAAVSLLCVLELLLQLVNMPELLLQRVHMPEMRFVHVYMLILLRARCMTRA